MAAASCACHSQGTPCGVRVLFVPTVRFLTPALLCVCLLLFFCFLCRFVRQLCVARVCFCAERPLGWRRRRCCVLGSTTGGCQSECPAVENGNGVIWYSILDPVLQACFVVVTQRLSVSRYQTFPPHHDSGLRPPQLRGSCWCLWWKRARVPQLQRERAN